MIKSDNGSVELVGNVNQILGELAAASQGIYYTLTAKKGKTSEEARKEIRKAVELGLDPDMVEVKEKKPDDMSDDELAHMLEQILGYLKSD